MRKPLTIAAWALAYAIATLAVFVGWSRQTPHTGWLTTQWIFLYLASVAYPAWWTFQLRRWLSADDGRGKKVPRGLQWSPIIVGGTSLLFALRLIEVSQR